MHCEGHNCQQRCLGRLMLSFFILISWALFSLFCPADDGVQVVCSSDINSSSLSPRDVTDIFLGRKRTLGDGSRIRLAVLKSGSVHNAFLAEYLGKSEKQFQRYWRNLVFSGRGMMPKVFSSEEKLAAYVATQKGIVGYLSNTNLIQNTELKRVHVEKGSE